MKDATAFLAGQERMTIAPDVCVGRGARIECIGTVNGTEYNGTLSIGAGTTIEFEVHIGAAGSITIGEQVMMGGHVTIMDHDHGYRDPYRPPRFQPLTVIPVVIEDNVWIGEYAFIGKGVHVGEHAVIGAHAVVTHDVPAYTVVAGNPARIIKTIEHYPPLVSIVILTMDRPKDLQACVDSIDRWTAEPYEVIVVDNGSKEHVLASEPIHSRVIGIKPNDTTVIRNETNVGFPAGANQGMRAAKGEWVLLLNDDTIVTPHWLDRMLTAAERGYQLLGPVTNYASGPQGQQGVKYATREELWQFSEKWAKEHFGQFMPISHLIGFCLLIHRSVIDSIGYLDESYWPHSYEEIDYCTRAALAGFKAGIVWDVYIHHTGSQTFKALGIDIYEMAEGGRKKYEAKFAAELAAESGH